MEFRQKTQRLTILAIEKPLGLLFLANSIELHYSANIYQSQLTSTDFN